MPGPGNYDVNTNLVKESARAYKMSNSKKESSLAQSKSVAMIGPGSYYKQESFGRNAPKVSIRGRLGQKDKRDSPGPGEYDPKAEAVRYKAPEFSMKAGSSQIRDRSIS